MDYSILKPEHDDDPLVRGYAGMTPHQVADAMHLLLYRDAPADPLAMLEYTTLERYRTGTIYGRVKMVADSRPVKNGGAWTIPPLPLGVGQTDITPTQKHIASANSLLRFLDTDIASTVTLVDSRFDSILDDLAGGGGVQAMGPNDKTALQGLSQNKQTRESELRLSEVKPGHIQEIRSLP